LAQVRCYDSAGHQESGNISYHIHQIARIVGYVSDERAPSPQLLFIRGERRCQGIGQVFRNRRLAPREGGGDCSLSSSKANDVLRIQMS